MLVGGEGRLSGAIGAGLSAPSEYRERRQVEMHHGPPGCCWASAADKYQLRRLQRMHNLASS